MLLLQAQSIPQMPCVTLDRIITALISFKYERALCLRMNESTISNTIVSYFSQSCGLEYYLGPHNV